GGRTRREAGAGQPQPRHARHPERNAHLVDLVLVRIMVRRVEPLRPDPPVEHLHRNRAAIPGGERERPVALPRSRAPIPPPRAPPPPRGARPVARAARRPPNTAACAARASRAPPGGSTRSARTSAAPPSRAPASRRPPRPERIHRVVTPGTRSAGRAPRG